MRKERKEGGEEGVLKHRNMIGTVVQDQMQEEGLRGGEEAND